MIQLAPRIVVDDRTQAGKPIVEGTRVPVEVVLGVLGAGESIDRVMKEYRLEKEDVLACLAYAASVLSGEEIRQVG